MNFFAGTHITNCPKKSKTTIKKIYKYKSSLLLIKVKILITPTTFTTVFLNVIFLKSSFPVNNYEISIIFVRRIIPNIIGTIPLILGILTNVITYTKSANKLAIN